MITTDHPITRRDFLKISVISLASLAVAPTCVQYDYPFPFLIGRVAVSLVYIYQKPSFTSQRVGKGTRDQLLILFDEIRSPDKGVHNPLWYRIPGGYVHSAHIQRILQRQHAPTLDVIPEGGILGEVVVPFTRAYRYSHTSGWQKLYRLYYSTVHWITEISEGPDRKAWYRLKDHLLDVDYFVPTNHLNSISPEVYHPISQDVPPDEKRIDVSIVDQILTASEGSQVVFTTTISSGLHTEKKQKDEISTDTPIGSFRIQMKLPSRHMGDGRLTSEIGAYELPGVPWTCVFHETGVAFHGTYWHNNFGQRMSHGCVNMRNEDALWLFRWTTPIFDPINYYAKGPGTLVVVK